MAAVLAQFSPSIRPKTCGTSGRPPIRATLRRPHNVQVVKTNFPPKARPQVRRARTLGSRPRIGDTAPSPMHSTEVVLARSCSSGFRRSCGHQPGLFAALRRLANTEVVENASDTRGPFTEHVRRPDCASGVGSANAVSRASSRRAKTGKTDGRSCPVRHLAGGGSCKGPPTSVIGHRVQAARRRAQRPLAASAGAACTHLQWQR